MPIHDTIYVSKRQRVPADSSSDRLSISSSRRHETASRRLKSLPWPKNLFGEHATIAELLAPRPPVDEDYLDDLCACGCGEAHQQLVSLILQDPHDAGFDLIHFRSFACSERWTRTNARSRHDGQRQAAAMATEDSRRAARLALGIPAPEFTLHVTPDQALSLSDFAGKPTIIAFYPADWSPVCGDQMVLYNQVLPEFRRYGAELLGVSVDGAWCHQAFAKHQNIHFPLLSDFEPKGAVARAYGAFRDADGVCERALFVLDRNHCVFWNYLAPIAVNPGADGILAALDRMVRQGV
jgi:peroxiredoxin